MIRISDKKVQSSETEHIEAVRKLAPECTVLSKSDGTLPLFRSRKTGCLRKRCEKDRPGRHWFR